MCALVVFFTTCLIFFAHLERYLQSSTSYILREEEEDAMKMLDTAWYCYAMLAPLGNVIIFLRKSFSLNIYDVQL